MRKTRTNLLKKLSKATIACLIVTTVLVTNDVRALADSYTLTIDESNSPYSDTPTMGGGATIGVVSGGIVSGGTFSREYSFTVEDGGSITDGSFYYVDNYGSISGGKFECISNEATGTIGGNVVVTLSLGDPTRVFVVNHGKIDGGKYNAAIDNYGVINAGTFDYTDTSLSYCCIQMFDGSTFVNGTVTGGALDFDGGTATIKNGTFDSVKIRWGINSSSNAIIEAGIFQNCSVGGTIYNGGQLTISDGTFNGGTIRSGNGETINISGGTFTGGVELFNTDKITISGGTFVNVDIPDNVTIADGASISISGYSDADAAEIKRRVAAKEGTVTVIIPPVITESSSSGSAAQATTEFTDSANSSIQATAISIETSFVGADGVTYRRLTAAGNPSIYVQGDESYLPAGGHFSYIPALDGTDAYAIASGIVTSRLRNVSNFSVIDMNLSDASHNAVHELSGNVYVTMPIPAGLTTTGKTLTVYRVDGPNTLTRCNTTTDGTSLTFTTNHFSTYVVVEQDGITSPKTGER